MNTLKSAALVVVLLGVLYGVYIVLSKPHMLALPGPTAQPGEDLGPPLVDFSSAGEAGHDDHDHVQAPTTVNASADLPPRGGSYQPNLDSPAMLPPPSLPSTEPPTDPTLASSAGEARHSSYESPEPPGSAAVPPLETSPPATNPPPDP
ncbi:MAG TPA: hypothetical protein VFV87_00505, partial [Pirellulaceae bacterium]|nr:hypothetical protein [Pirellulaceae bacterium]